MFARRPFLAALVLPLLIHGAPLVAAPKPSAAAPALSSSSTAVRMQNVVMRFTQTTGNDMIGLGSWISGKKYSDVLMGGTSDHDLRLLSNAQTPAEAQRDWLRARQTLTDLIKKEFGQDADKVLRSVNLYPPNQLMTGVEDAGEALARFQKLGAVPNMGYSGDVAAAPAKFAEGLYGPGSTVWVQDYEKTAGRLFYSRNGQAFVGFTDLTHMAEGMGRYDVQGMCNTSVQWCDHIVEELKAGHGDKVAKYLERLERDLTKARSLARLDLDPAWRAQVKQIVSALKKDPSKIHSLSGVVESLLARSQGEVQMIRAMTSATPVERKILEQALKEMKSGKGAFGRLAEQANEAGGGLGMERTLQAILIMIQVRQTARYAGEEQYEQAAATAITTALGLASLPVGFVAEMTTCITEAAKDAGFNFAANTQDAWDLMAGLYTAVGRTSVDDGRAYTLEDLVEGIEDPAKLRDVVYAKAMLAASRSIDGAVTGTTDQKVGEAIFNRCYPVILQAWQARRDQLAVEFAQLADELVHTPVLLEYKPNPAEFKPGRKTVVTVTGTIDDANFSQKLERARAILKKLYHKNAYADYDWTWSGGRDGGAGNKRIFEFDALGTYPVVATVKLRLGAAAREVTSILSRTEELRGGVDVRVQEAEPTFDYTTMDFNILIWGPGVIQRNYPYRSNYNRTEATKIGIQLITDKTPFTMKGRVLTASFKSPSGFGNRILADVKVEMIFSENFASIEQMTVNWNCPWIDPTYHTEALEKWSFTARGIPMEPDLWEWRDYSVDFDLEDGDKPPKGFQLVHAEYLKTQVEHKKRYDDHDNIIEYDDTYREDQFQLAGVKDVGISVRFNPPAEPRP